MRILLVGFSMLACASPSSAQSVFFGNLHAHTSYSDGSGTPDQAYETARLSGLHFLAITEHNHRNGDGSFPRERGLLIARQPELYSGQPTSLVEAADRHNQPGTFVAIYGQEVSAISKGNHINVFGARTVIDDVTVPDGEFDKLLNWVSSHPDASGRAPLMQFNHPRNPDSSSNAHDYGRDDFPTGLWVSSLDPFVELIEILNGKALTDGEGFRAETKESSFLKYLNLGFHAAPSVGHDDHYLRWGRSTDARIGVVAPTLTREAIMAALRARHAFATDDKNLKIIFRSGNALGGDIVPALTEGTPLPLSVEIMDGDPAEANAQYRVEVLSDEPGGTPAGTPVETFMINGNTAGRVALDGVLSTGPGQYVLLRIVQSRPATGTADHDEPDDRAWTAPIWYEASVPLSPPPAMRISRVVPNPAGDEVQNETVTIANDAGAAIDIRQWQLRDATGNVWRLDGSVSSGQSLTIRRLGQPMSLNNNGDLIELVDGGGRVIDRVTYGRASEGQALVPQRP